MSEIKLDSRIKSAGDLSIEAIKKLHRLQTGEEFIFKTGLDFIDVHIGGILPSDVLLISAPSGAGKTKLMYDLLDSILDENVNKESKDFVVLDFALELPFLNRLLRDANKLLGKKKKDIIHTSFTEEEASVIKDYHKGMKDTRRFICEETINTTEFFQMSSDFCKKFEDKKAVVICIDHLLLVSESKPGEDTMKTLSMHVNNLRKTYKNVYFILLSQFNRSAYENVQDKNNKMIPTVAMIYGSSHFEFLSSFIVAILDPFKMGVNQYMNVNRERYDWLQDYMTEEDNKGKVSFNTLGNLFIHTLKTRESDQPYKNLYIKPMNLSSEQLDKMKQGVEESKSSPVVSAPVFNSNTTPVFNPLNGFKGTDFDDSAPF